MFWRCFLWHRQHYFYNNNITSFFNNQKAFTSKFKVSSIKETCFMLIPEYEECTRSQLGYEYNGRVNMTSSGKTCQRWDTQTPHKHIYGRLAAHENYCRNPFGLKQRPFCFTTDKTTPWEYCNITACSTFPTLFISNKQNVTINIICFIG